MEWLTKISRRQWIGIIATLLAVVSFGTSWSHCVTVLVYGGVHPDELVYLIASLPEVTCLLVALRLMDGQGGGLTWSVGGISFGFTVLANYCTAGGQVAPWSHWLWSHLGALWPAVSVVMAFLLMGHGKGSPDPKVVPVTPKKVAPRDPSRVTPPGTRTAHVVPAAEPKVAPRVTDHVTPETSQVTPPGDPSRGTTNGSPDPSKVTRDLMVEWAAGEVPLPPVATLMARYGVSETTAKRVRSDVRARVNSGPGADGGDP